MRRSTSADDIASMVAAIDHTSLVAKGARKRGRAATPRAAASCVVLGGGGVSSGSLSSSASPPQARGVDVDALLGAAVAAGLAPQVGPPAEQNNNTQDPPQPHGSVAWLRAALGLGPA